MGCGQVLSTGSLDVSCMNCSGQAALMHTLAYGDSIPDMACNPYLSICFYPFDIVVQISRWLLQLEQWCWRQAPWRQ